jgi:hypothetical protein
MINMTLKCQEKNMCKKVHNFHHYTTWFLAPLILLHSLAEIYSHNQTQNILLWSCVEKRLNTLCLYHLFGCRDQFEWRPNHAHSNIGSNLHY